MLVGVPVQLYLLYMRGLRFVQLALLRLGALALALPYRGRWLDAQPLHA